MSNEATSVATGNLEEIVGILGLTTAELDMRHHFPQDVPVGRGCGVFFGIGGGGHVPAGDGKLVALTETRLHLDGKFKFLWYEGSAEVAIELLGNGKARLRLPHLAPGWMNALVWKEEDDLRYKVLDGPMKDAGIKQIYDNAGWISGAYVEFHINYQGKYYEAKYWFHKG